MYAVVETGGKQYRMTPGDTVRVERLDGEVGESVTLDQVLLVAGDDGAVTVGSPTVDGVTVTAEIVGHGRGQKILVFKYKPKANYRRRQGHRQPYTELKVTAVGAAETVQKPKRTRAKKAAGEAAAEGGES